jgi:hypothetical protein
MEADKLPPLDPASPGAKLGRHKGKWWQCGVYDLAKGNKTCAEAIAPDGAKGCRACWMFRDLDVSYVMH